MPIGEDRIVLQEPSVGMKDEGEAATEDRWRLLTEKEYQPKKQETVENFQMEVEGKIGKKDSFILPCFSLLTSTFSLNGNFPPR